MEFETLTRRTGLEISDPIENTRFELYVPAPITPVQTRTGRFYFPVDAAVGFETASVEIPKLVSPLVWTQSGELVADSTRIDGNEFPAGDYLLELNSTSMKLYLAFESGFRLERGETAVTVRCEGTTRIRVGARSLHEHPAGTITVTDEVRDVMRAVSLFGSALKTLSPERSFPTLRGHPPLIERGETFSVPGEIEPPETDVTLVLPPERTRVYTASSLAYYLGAEIIAGDEPRLIAGNFEQSLDGPDGYEATVNSILRRTFFFDCLARTEGFYDVELYERKRVESRMDVDLESLYDAPLADRVERALSLPFERVESVAMDWNLTTDIVPTKANVEALPFVAYDLSFCRTPSNPTERNVTEPPKAFDDFARNASDWRWDDDDFFQVASAPTAEHAWIGNGYPLGVNKLTLESLYRRLDRPDPDDSTLTVHVVCNDETMEDEKDVAEQYGVRDFVESNVSVHHQLAGDELSELLSLPSDFVHFIGHVDSDGFRCPDGHLDAESLSSVETNAFLLNACRSYEQGTALIEKGSQGGVVTMSPVLNSAATRVGKALARLLNAGFPLRVALEIARTQLVDRHRYLVVGDGALTLCQSESGQPIRLDVEPNGDGYVVTPVAYPTQTYGLGTVLSPMFDEQRYIGSGTVRAFELSADELDAALGAEVMPVEANGTLHWSDELSTSDL
ncbi:hypothetical protein ZOD2009_06534 [Haladaptatus paucihalophilus DX253]|uniref:CHAT domain-containing protein n=1 Tax=Haladaptatus paucihalophilus DX253 TaxID=797209 RepID=E7QR84_HALPU|nr:hypothetical protein [Haladaptatus paucihalophilus]EFW92992.1 hypothetical protein ZOD2009_06534 [Haladaptatus paucihalophilus DX253]SHL17348.1 hypothetical protein SAMN05444342_3129 [Haladaptatus paucihalophilus DX253]